MDKNQCLLVHPRKIKKRFETICKLIRQYYWLSSLFQLKTVLVDVSDIYHSTWIIIHQSHPPHLRSVVQAKSDVLHLHNPLHTLVHPHFIIARYASPAVGRVIHCICHCALSESQIQSKSAELSNAGTFLVDCYHKWPAMYPTLNKCCVRASIVGSILSIYLPFWGNNTCLS